MGMNVSGDLQNSNSNSNSGVEGTGFDSDTSTQFNGAEQDGGENTQAFDMQGLAEDFKSPDSRTSGNAAQDIISDLTNKAQQELDKPEGECTPQPGASDTPSTDAGSKAPGGEAASLEEMMKKLIEQFVKQYGLNDDQSNKLSNTAQENNAPPVAQTQSA